ncbi:MAG TPA: tetratricopeptide repeat protein [Planctomycetaceae bacterium]|jgi:tetratricopeptide (TPR) repeat protein|nr:tetratricopeptide repeat protein [Planctomycetaceae bacterium]
MQRIFGISLFAIGSLFITDECLAAGTGAGQTVCLTVREPAADGGAGSIASMGLRELVRQAFLLAARDELGLATRDVMLREDFPEKQDPASAPFELFCRSLDPPITDKGDKIECVLTRRGAPEKVLWRVVYVPEYYPALGALPVQAEIWSRKELKDVLVQAGFQGSVPPRRASFQIPSETYDLLWTWNEISVMAGLRRIHQEIRENGESPELLGALAVGYANLGTLAEFYYSGACKVYYARALLYEERLSKETNDTPWSLYHSAYVVTQLGIPNVAVPWVADAKKKLSAAGTDKPLPFFANVMEAFIEGKLRKMLEIAKTPAERRLAHYFNVEAILFGDLDDLTVRAIKEFLRECPDCPRAYDMLSRSNELGPSREGAESAFGVTRRLLRKQLLDFPGLPKSVVERVRAAGTKPEPAEEVALHKGVVSDLKKAGRAGVDRGEPSLAALGQTIEEIDFAQLVQQLTFFRNKLSVPIKEILETYGPLGETHPYAGYLSSFTWHRKEMEAGAAALTKKLEVFAFTMKDRPVMQWLYSLTAEQRFHDLYQVPGKHCDSIFIDDMRCMKVDLFGPPDDPKYGAPNMARAWAMCDKLPVAVAMRITRDWPRAKTEVEKYEHVYAEEPIVLYALTNRYLSLKRYSDAERCAKRHVEVHPSYPSYRSLAAAYKGQKNEAKWKETLDKAIELPPLGLEQASIQNQIAHHFLEKHDYQQAVIYADAAAESYSGWSMLTAARCHEMLGEWKKSEQFVRAVAERYENSDWMYWCHRTGRGDVAAADELVRKQLEDLGTGIYSHEYVRISIYYLLTNEPDKSLLVCQRAYQLRKDPYIGLLAAIIADGLDKTVNRDRLFTEITSTTLAHNYAEAPTQDYYKRLAALMRDTVTTKKVPHLNLVEFDKLQAEAAPEKLYPSVLLYLVGVFLKNRGDLENAKKYLIRAAQSDDWGNSNHVLACQLLREMKVQVPPREASTK